MNLSWPLVGVTMGGLALVGAAVLMPVTAQGGGTDSLRVVRVGGELDIDAVRQRVAGLERICRAGKNLPEAPPTPLSDASLRAVKAHEVEELFDGRDWAAYRTRRIVAPDVSQDCRPVVLVERSATVEHTCESRLAGHSARLNDLMAGPAAPAPADVTERPLPRKRCDTPVPELPVGLPQQPAGQGASCIWMSQALGKAQGAAAGDAAGPATDGTDQCLYAKRPRQAYQASRRPVVLMSRSPQRGATNALQAEAHAAFNEKLESFTEGGTIEPRRFTRAGIEAFIRLPQKEALEARP